MKDFTKEKVEELVINSETISEVLTKMDYAKSSDAYKVFIKFAKNNNIDISKLLIRKKETSFKKKVELSEAMVENSTFSRVHLKGKLIRAGIKKEECEECGQGRLWRGREMHLILDHINGVNNDNRLENLRLLCPNCNATLDTHGGKKLRKYKTCEECKGQYHGINDKFCTMKCSSKYIARINKRARKAERPKFEDLMLEIEETSFSAVGRKYGVSDNAIRKWIKNYQKNGNEE
jgi:hypothetical protein